MTTGKEFGVGSVEPDPCDGKVTGGRKINTWTVRPLCRDGSSNLYGNGPFGLVRYRASRGTARGSRTRAVFQRVEKDSLLHLPSFARASERRSDIFVAVMVGRELLR